LPPIVLDTHIFRKLFSDYFSLLECITETGDLIVYDHRAEKEYRGRYEPTGLGFKSYLDKVKTISNIKKIKSSRVTSKNKRYKRKKKLPTDGSDIKWVEIAICEDAKFIISNDPDLSLPSFRTNGNVCRLIRPHTYLIENCPDMLN